MDALISVLLSLLPNAEITQDADGQILNGSDHAQ